MKKLRGLVLLGSALFLFGCGGGGTTTTSSYTGSTGGTTGTGGGGGGTTGATGTITINFVQPTTTTAANSPRLLATASAQPAANYVRVLIRNISTDDVGTVMVNYSKIVNVDLTTSATSASATVPAGPGYAVDVISAYSLDHGIHNKMLKYGNVADVTVNPGVNSAIPITLQKIDTTLTVPAAVPTGTTYYLAVSKLAFPLGTANYYRTATSAFTDNAFTTGTPITLANIFLTADTIANATDPSIVHYFQAVFSIDSAFLDPAVATDVAANWTYYYPDLTLTPADPSVSTTVQPPGNLPITVTL